MSSTDTIFALATPPGKSGVAVLRLSGARSLEALTQLTRLQNITPRHVNYVTFHDPLNWEIIDSGLAIYFKAPHSFTGEDVVELHIHGSIASIKQMLSTLGKMPGLRPAEAGEFTRRAFMGGKMDLLEAEGLADLIDASTTEQKSQAMRQMQGELSGFYDELRTRIVRALALLEAYIDFPDEDIPDSVLTDLNSEIQTIQNLINESLDDGRAGERLRDGIDVVIVGAPNAGKSSLLNLIAKRDAAIVSHKAGTTRDIIEIHLDISGYPVTLVDTAGLRESDEEIEAEGIKRAMKRAGDADIKLVVFDGSQLPQVDSTSLSLLDSNSILLVNKCDIATSKEWTASTPVKPLFISASTGQGVNALFAELESRISGFFSQHEAPFITRARHRSLLEESHNYLLNSTANLPLELKCEELRCAAQAVGKITGKIQVDDVLDVIFSSFCIGK